MMRVEIFRIPGGCWSWGIARHHGLIYADLGRIGVIVRRGR